MLAPERLRQQSSRHSDPVESCYLPFQTANTNEGGVGLFVKRRHFASAVAFAGLHPNIGAPGGTPAFSDGGGSSWVRKFR
jgi:hypothetical protein